MTRIIEIEGTFLDATQVESVEPHDGMTFVRMKSGGIHYFKSSVPLVAKMVWPQHAHLFRSEP